MLQQLLGSGLNSLSGGGGGNIQTLQQQLLQDPSVQQQLSQFQLSPQFVPTHSGQFASPSHHHQLPQFGHSQFGHAARPVFHQQHQPAFSQRPHFASSQTAFHPQFHVSFFTL